MRSMILSVGAAGILATALGRKRCRRDRAGRDRSAPRHRQLLEPQIVKKRQRRLTGIDEIVLSLTAKGLTTGEVAAHFADVYGATVSKDTISGSPTR